MKKEERRRRGLLHIYICKRVHSLVCQLRAGEARMLDVKEPFIAYF